MAVSDTSSGPKLPYDGLFGDSNLIRVMRQVIADPFTEYRPIDLEMLTQNSPPTVRESLRILTSVGILIKDESDHQHPVYRVDTESKRYHALTFLAYAVLDDRNGTDCMDDVIADYYSESREKYEYSQPVTVTEMTYHSAIRTEHLGESCLVRLPSQDLPQVELYATSIPATDTGRVVSGHREPETAAASA